jgi:hypothetical protein
VSIESRGSCVRRSGCGFARRSEPGGGHGRAWLFIIGLAGGAAVAAAEGVRRTEAAYPRFVQAQNGYDLTTGGFPGQDQSGNGRPERHTQTARRCPHRGDRGLARGFPAVGTPSASGRVCPRFRRSAYLAANWSSWARCERGLLVWRPPSWSYQSLFCCHLSPPIGLARIAEPLEKRVRAARRLPYRGIKSVRARGALAGHTGGAAVPPWRQSRGRVERIAVTPQAWRSWRRVVPAVWLRHGAGLATCRTSRTARLRSAAGSCAAARRNPCSYAARRWRCRPR